MTQIPNLLSASRLVLAPFVFLFLWRREYSIALALLVIAGITDGLGHLGAIFGPVGGCLNAVLVNGLGAPGAWLLALVPMVHALRHQ